MPVAAEDRPLDTLRQDTIDQLVLNYAHGRLSLDAFERRLDEALDATSHEILVTLTHDLDLAPPLPSQAAEAPKAPAGSAGAARPEPFDGFARPRTASGDARDTEQMVHIFSATNRRGPWTVAREIRMLNVFGAAELDFSEARFSAPRTTIRMLCVFGAATLFVPEGVNVISKPVCLFGSVDNRAASAAGDGPTIVVEGLFLFGAASVKIRKTLKKRLLEAGETLRSLFGQNEPRGRR